VLFFIFQTGLSTHRNGPTAPAHRLDRGAARNCDASAGKYRRPSQWDVSTYCISIRDIPKVVCAFHRRLQWMATCALTAAAFEHFPRLFFSMGANQSVAARGFLIWVALYAVLERSQDPRGRQLVRVTLAKPDSLESTRRLSEFVVLESQISE
jgi:hypothetical protein